MDPETYKNIIKILLVLIIIIVLFYVLSTDLQVNMSSNSLNYSIANIVSLWKINGPFKLEIDNTNRKKRFNAQIIRKKGVFLVFGSGKVIATGFKEVSSAGIILQELYPANNVNFIKTVNITAHSFYPFAFNIHEFVESSKDANYEPEIYPNLSSSDQENPIDKFYQRMLQPGPLGGKVKELFQLMEAYAEMDESNQDKCEFVVRAVLFNMLKNGVDQNGFHAVKKLRKEIRELDRQVNNEAKAVEKLFAENKKLKEMLGLMDNEDLTFAQYALKELQRLTKVPQEVIEERSRGL